jgi:hypothetical protein
MDIHNFSPDEPYKYVLYAVTIVFICSLENSFFDIDINKIRTTCVLIFIYALVAWVLDDSWKNSVNEDVRGELYDEDDVVSEYNKKLRGLNICFILISVLTVISKFY